MWIGRFKTEQFRTEKVVREERIFFSPLLFLALMDELVWKIKMEYKRSQMRYRKLTPTYIDDHQPPTPTYISDLILIVSGKEGLKTEIITWNKVLIPKD